MEYEWDTNKNRANIRKHGVDFKEAALVFNDPNYIELLDNTNYQDTLPRYNAIGYVHKLLFVVFVEKSANTIRIISARKATKKEEAIYDSAIY